MAKPTEKNMTGVESFDHSRVAGLTEYHEARKALDALVHAMNSADTEVGQEAFLKMAEQMAASLSYADSSGHRNDDCQGNTEGAWPYKVVLDPGGEGLKGWYRCAYCGQEWTVGYAVNIAEFI